MAETPGAAPHPPTHPQKPRSNAGRGFSITASSFVKLFANYGRSHLYAGFELLVLLLVFAAANDCEARGAGGPLACPPLPPPLVPRLGPTGA